MKILHALALGTISLTLLSGSAQAAAITANNIVVSLQTPNGYSSDFFSGTSIPGGDSLDATDGAYYSRMDVSYTGSGNQVTLANTLSQNRPGNIYNTAQGYDSSMTFYVDANTTYELSGYYNVTDVSSPGRVYFHSLLYDITLGTYLFNNNQWSQGTLNESFVLGETGGDSANYLVGSLTGSLIAGHTYQWFFNAYIQAYPDADGGASATGNFTLEIGGGANTPDSGATLALLGLALSGMAWARRKLT